MPNWNMGRYIGSAVQSVLSQSYKDLELIVVDAGSTDESISIVENFAKADSRVRLIMERPRKGVSNARNVGMKESTGKQLCFIDSDDIFMPTRIGKMVDALQHGSDSIVFTDVFRIDRDGTVLRSSFIDRLPDAGNAYASVLTRQIQGQNTMMIPTSAQGSVGYFDESIRWGEDFEYLLRLTERYGVLLVKEPLYGYRKHENSASSLTAYQSKGRAYIRILESNLERNWEKLDSLTKLRVIWRIQDIAKESHAIDKYVSWKTSPRFLKLRALKLIREKLC